MHQHYMGSSRGNHYVLMSQLTLKKDHSYPNWHLKEKFDRHPKIVKYNSKFEFIEEYPIEFNHRLDMVEDALVTNEAVFIAYTSPENYGGLYIDKYSLDMQSSTSEYLEVGPNAMITRSRSGELICITSSTQIGFYNHKLEKTWSLPPQTVLIYDIIVTDNGLAYFLRKTVNDIEVVKFDIKNKQQTSSRITSHKRLDKPGFKLFEDQLCVVSQVMKEFKENRGSYYAEGLQIDLFDLNNLDIRKSNNVTFTDSVASSVHDVLLDKPNYRNPSIHREWLQYSNAFKNSDGELYIVMQNYVWIKVISSQYETSMLNHKERNKNIILVKIDNEGKNTQKVVPARTWVTSLYNHLLSNISDLCNDSLYLIHNEGYKTNKYKFTTTVLTKDLKIVRRTSENLRRKAGINAIIKHSEQIEDHKYLVLGRNFSKNASIIIDFYVR